MFHRIPNTFTMQLRSFYSTASDTCNRLSEGLKGLDKFQPTTTVEMITMYCVGTTPVSIVVPILITNIFSTLAVNISKILVIYTVIIIIVLRVKTYFKKDY